MLLYRKSSLWGATNWDISLNETCSGCDFTVLEIIQLFLNTKLPSWLDNNWKAGPQPEPVAASQLQSQGGALDTWDLRHQRPRHQEDRPAGGDRQHQGSGGQGAVQISDMNVEISDIFYILLTLDIQYDIWAELQTISTVYTVKLRLGCEMELSLYPHDVQVLLHLQYWPGQGSLRPKI